MFRKSFIAKSKNAVKNSERRALIRLMPEVEIALRADEKLFAQKADTIHCSVIIYSGDKCPLFFEFIDNGARYFVPTVYSLWLCPNAHSTLLIYKPVFEKLESGADLMLPGIINNTRDSLPQLKTGDIVAISILDHSSASIADGVEVLGPVAVGRALMSSEAMLDSEMRGKGIQILHVYRDYLWQLGDKRKPPSVKLEQFSAQNTTNVEGNLSGEQPDVESNSIKRDEARSLDEVAERVGNIEIDAEQKAAVDVDDSADMEMLLQRTFLSAVRYKVQDSGVQLPIDAGQFYASFVLTGLPPGKRLDLKRTKYRKFSAFLRQVDEEIGSGDWLVKIVTKKGVDYIEKLNFEHAAVRGAQPPTPADEEGDHSLTAGSSADKPQNVRVSECLSITNAALAFIRQLSSPLSLAEKPVHKGDVMQQDQIRDLVLRYASEHNLIRDGGTRLELDDTLQTLMQHFLPATLAINDVVQRIVALMTRCYVVSTGDDARPRVHRGKAPYIVLKVEKRSGNKVVTLVNNLSTFGIDTRPFCQSVQNAQATGTSVTPNAPECDGPQVLVHGNVVNFIGEELLKAYGLPKKYIKGLELGVKEKKKKK